MTSTAGYDRSYVWIAAVSIVLFAGQAARAQETASPPDEPATAVDGDSGDGETGAGADGETDPAPVGSVAAAMPEERIERRSFLRRLHLDAFWMPSSSEGGVYGMIGAHLVIADVGRFHFFGPPGVMLVLDGSDGQRRVRPAFTWGLGIYLVEVRMPGTSHDVRLFLNLAKVWSMGDHQMGADMAGLSMTWKR